MNSLYLLFQDHDESLCDFSLKDELNMTDGEGNGAQGDGPLVDFDAHVNKTCDSIESKDEDEKIALLEGTVSDLHKELELAESRVAELLRTQTGARAKAGKENNSILLEVRDELEEWLRNPFFNNKFLSIEECKFS